MQESGIKITKKRIPSRFKWCKNRGWWRTYSDILKTMQESGIKIHRRRIRVALDGCKNSDRWDVYSDILKQCRIRY